MGVNVPHPEFTFYHNNEYPWKDNSAIILGYNTEKHWFIPNDVTRGINANREYYFHILAEDNYIPHTFPTSTIINCNF